MKLNPLFFALGIFGMAGVLIAAAITPIGLNDCSGTIASGGTAQVLIPAASRSMLLIQSDTTTDLLAFSAVTTTPAVNTAGSWTLNPVTSTTAGGSYGPSTFAFGNGPIYIIGATTGDGFSCHWR